MTVKSRLKWSIKALFIICGSVITVEAQEVSSSHSMTVSGSGEGDCAFCHTSHGMTTNEVLWNVKLTTAVYKIYQSTSLDAKVGQPTGSSKLCLSCHDGTVAPTNIKGDSRIATQSLPGEVTLGTDLSDDHPVSFAYTADILALDPQIRSPATLLEYLKLDKNFEMQCTTCHDPHTNIFGHFLVMPNYQSLLCTSCHQLTGWSNSVHQNSPASLTNADDAYLRNSEYTTMIDCGCLSCHRPHSAGGRQRLLHFENEEDNCLNCHNGSVAQTNLLPDLVKTSRHDTRRYTKIHDIKETAGIFTMHVECADCHNPHAIQNYATQAPQVSGLLNGVSGISATGSIVPQASNAYEICFKCHGDNPDRIDSRIARQITQTNTRLEFAPSNPSFHPVLAPGKNRDVPSLKPGIDITTMIYCTDCHNSDSGSDVRGPHGSQYPPLLAFNYKTEDQIEENSFAYELCYQCHSRNSILANESFSMHQKHLENNAPCSACHDPHGINSTQGTMMNNSHLINFDISIVSAEPATRRLEFEDLGTFSGRCYLLCHNKQHSGEIY